MLFAQALALREAQDMDGALDVAARAHAAAPSNPDFAYLHAQLNFETWRPAARLFRDAQRLDPENLAITKSAAQALFAEGNGQTAISLMEKALARKPDWLDGYKLLVTMLQATRRAEAAKALFTDALVAQPDNLTLQLEYFRYLAQARDWEKADAVLFEAERRFEGQKRLVLSRLFLTSESHASSDLELFAQVSNLHDPGTDLAHVRHLLRLGAVKEAEQICEAQTSGNAARMFWPYLSLCWRLLGDDRAAWLDRDEELVRTFDVGLSSRELGHLAVFLRALHIMQAPYIDQSVRGGTQTDRHLFFHHAVVMQNVRAKISECVRDYVAALGPPEASHPLLSLPRNQALRYSGAWSVWLQSEGFHACHTHPLGWISSALYVALPDTSGSGDPNAGWLQCGTPPPELGLKLGPTKLIEPMPGKLVLFPSTTWHGTLPFAAGERLTIAFDVRLPDAAG